VTSPQNAWPVSLTNPKIIWCAALETGNELTTTALVSWRHSAPGKNNKQNQREGSMAIPWTVHIPQALQQHGARRTWRDVAESDRLADLKAQSAEPNQAEDEAGPPTLRDRRARL
jgi:hypothetical protein